MNRRIFVTFGRFASPCIHSICLPTFLVFRVSSVPCKHCCIRFFFENDRISLHRKEKLRKSLSQLNGTGCDMYASVLRECGNTQALMVLKLVHSYMVRNELESAFLCNLLVDMYGRCGSLADAEYAFRKLTVPNVYSWNAMIATYVQYGRDDEALHIIMLMQAESVGPDNFSFANALSACAHLVILPQGKFIHALVIGRGLLYDIVLGNTLVNMYGKCGSFNDAYAVFMQMNYRNVVSWTSMITVYAQNDRAMDAITCYQCMRLAGVHPNAVTIASSLDACADTPRVKMGILIHALTVQKGLALDVIVGNSLINMYGKDGNLVDAQQVFGTMLQPNMVSWTVMISAYAHNCYSEEALELFRKMLQNALKPNAVTFLSILEACCNLASLEVGTMIHAYISGVHLEIDENVSTALVDMYGKCGSLRDALVVFNRMRNPDLVSWTTMIAACCQNGQAKEALQMFTRMTGRGIKPDKYTFTNILSSCNHEHLLHEGRQYFCSMSQHYSVTPTTEHYICMVDLVGRVGQLDEAEDFVNQMPGNPSAITWTTLLAACKVN